MTPVPSQRGGPSDGDVVQCVVCSQDIPASIFAEWDTAHKMVATVCPHCGCHLFVAQQYVAG